MYQDTLRNQSEKEIYQQGALRIVSILLQSSVFVCIFESMHIKFNGAI
jgi:hypothetical protein